MYSPIYTEQQLVLHTASLLELSTIQYKHRNQKLAPSFEKCKQNKDTEDLFNQCTQRKCTMRNNTDTDRRQSYLNEMEFKWEQSPIITTK